MGIEKNERCAEKKKGIEKSGSLIVMIYSCWQMGKMYEYFECALTHNHK